MKHRVTEEHEDYISHSPSFAAVCTCVSVGAYERGIAASRRLRTGYGCSKSRMGFRGATSATQKWSPFDSSA
jgi:hypothetical protein